MNFIVLGPQGSGKGTQAEILAKKYNLEHIEMGKFLREVAKTNTDLGRKVHEIINVRKELVDDKILKKVLHIKLADIPREQGIVFDGVPRRQDQKEYLENALREFGRKIDAVILVNIPEEESVKRISRRWICEKNQHPLIMGVDVQSEKDRCPFDGSKIFQRLDDTPEGARKRLRVYQEETVPVIEDFRRRGLLIKIDGTPKIEEVSQKIFSEIEKLKDKF